MAVFRIEAVRDVATGLYFTEVFFPEEATTPFTATGPIYSSPEEAEADAVKIFRDAMSSGAISGKAK